MKKYGRLLVSYAAIAAVATLAYAPQFGIGLNPFDASGSILSQGFAIILGIVLASGLTASTYSYLKAPTYRLLTSDEASSAEQVLPLLSEYSETSVVGKYAAEGIGQIESMARKRRRLEHSLETSFSPGSMSWDRFASVVDAAQQAIIKNCAMLANRIQSFDLEGYQHAHRLLRKADELDRELAEERERVYTDYLSDMGGILTANERLLLEMSKLEDELLDLDQSASEGENDSLLEEVQTLIEQTKYYR